MYSIAVQIVPLHAGNRAEFKVAKLKGNERAAD